MKNVSHCQVRVQRACQRMRCMSESWLRVGFPDFFGWEAEIARPETVFVAVGAPCHRFARRLFASMTEVLAEIEDSLILR